MNDKTKTGLEREINRKLDALKVTIEALAYHSHWMAKEEVEGVRDAIDALKKAWKEEEEVRRGPV